MESVLRRLQSWHERGRLPARMVVAVSGGSDSVGLLRILHAIAPEWGLKLTIAHLNHGVRGEAAEADARFVSELARRLSLPFELGRWTPGRDHHFESDARQARYRWLVDVARSRQAGAVAVGHTRDDQAETILHRIVRGTGLSGLAGMSARRPLAEGITLIRPLLDVTRAEIRSYLSSLDQSWREDATNTDLDQTRARIRLDLLPKLAGEYNPRVADALVRLGGHARNSVRRVDERLRRIERHAVVTVGPDEIVLRRAPMESLVPDLRAELIRRAWRRAGWPEAGMTAARWQRLADSDPEQRDRFSVGHGIDAWLSRETLRLAPAPLAPDSPIIHESAQLLLPGACILPRARGKIVATLEPDAVGDEVVDLDRVEPWTDGEGQTYLFVSTPADGDRFEPLGMGGRSMPLNDFFRGRKVTREHRGLVPLVRDRAGILWVVGHRIADRVQRTDHTTRTLGLAWVPCSE